MPVEQAVLDFHPLEELVERQRDQVLRGLLVAASRDMVNASLEAVQKAGLSPVMVDLTSFAVVRSLADADHLGMGASVEALVDVGARVTNIVVHQGGVPRFVRILMMGGQDVTDAVAERLGVPQEQAEAMKQQIGAGAAPAGTDTAAASRVVEAVSATFVDEVRGSLDYYLASSGSTPISRLGNPPAAACRRRAGSSSRPRTSTRRSRSASNRATRRGSARRSSVSATR